MSNSNEVFLSVVVPTIGRELLKDSVSSVVDSLSQSGISRNECEIVVSDQSGNVTPSWFLQLSNKYQIRVVYSNTRGAAINRNHGAAHAKGQVIGFLDDDCTADINWVNIILSKFSGSGSNMITGQVLSTGDDSKTPSTIDLKESEVLCNPDLHCWRLYSGSMALCRQDFYAIGGFDERFLRKAQDVDFGYRWLNSGRILEYEPSLVAFHQDWRSEGEAHSTEGMYEWGAGFFYGIHSLSSTNWAKKSIRYGFSGITTHLIMNKSVSPTARGIIAGLLASLFRKPIKWNSGKAKYLHCRNKCEQ